MSTCAPERRGPRAGFTLTELVIVVMVMALTLSFGYSSIGGIREGLSVSTASDQFRSANNLARAIAIRSNSTAQLRISEDGQSFWVQVDTSLAATTVMDTVGTLVDLEESRVKLASSGSVFCFDPRGIPTTAGECDDSQWGVLVFARGSKADTIIRTPLGMIPR